MIKDILKTLKANHYVKNLVVFVPLIFSMNIFNIDKIIKEAGIFIAFCFISSAVYIMNDLADIKQDRKHPIKCNRPIASGRISKSYAINLLCGLMILSFCTSFYVQKICIITIITFFLLNVLYSLWLKKIALIDVACIAFGFILRILSGCFAIQVLPSPLIILMTFFLSMFFTFSKRKLELQLVDTQNRRSTLKVFDISTINQFVMINAILAISFYYTYVLDGITIERAGTKYLYLTSIPFTLIIFQLLLLVNSPQKGDDPIVFIEKNKQMKFLLFLYLITLLIVLLWLK